MKRIAITGVVLTVLSTAAPVTQTAQAHYTHRYRGGCTFGTADGIPLTEPLGGEGQWTGYATAFFVATTAADSETDPNTSVPTPTDQIGFECTLWRNGINVGVVLSGSGIGIAYDPDGAVTFTADETEIVQLCEEVTVGEETHSDSSIFDDAWCTDATRTPIVPEPVANALAPLISTLDNVVLAKLDAIVICPLFLALSPVVNPIDPTIAFIFYPDGDVDLLGKRFWDCPSAVADLDGDGDLESVTSDPDPSLTAGQWRQLTPEYLDASECNTRPEPVRTSCRYFSHTVYGAGTGGAAAEMAVADWDFDLENEVIVTGGGGPASADIDNDGDGDIIWRLQ